ncbi:hypothetical protein FRC96_17715 [Lujinxingia vulgaris]|uniref:Carboxypeptidase regulatory-like domain-containing protein n=1 Tax=Lujinxingia vulgaris TaxID=2600176 RepID=A0A5C6X5E5_9DELT|nr:hypothetical protein [Lujinxingia vulgaris]TXD32394.1 hypothetical protein FRC96_17715 [Lujinxingia vulgaris]
MLKPHTRTSRYLRPFGALSLLALLGLMLSACESEPQGPPPPPPEFEFPIDIQVTGPEDAPIGAAAVELDGQIVGFTDADGIFKATLVETPGTEVSLKVIAPEGYRVAENGEIVDQLRVTETIGGQLSSLPLTLQTKVISLRHTYMGWVQANCDDRIKDGACNNLPVHLNGEEVARTDDRGVAQFAFEGIPGRTAEVSIHTPAFEPGVDGSPFFEPKRPSYELALGYDETIFRIQQDFTDPTVKKAPRRATRRSSTRRPARKKTPPKEEEGNNHIINLW